MRLTRTSAAAYEPVDEDHFTGNAKRRNLGAVEAPRGTALVVSFEPGARTYWHRHPDGQYLWVVEGRGRIATRDEGAVAIEPGDLVYAPPGEEHWHGASAESGVTHLAFSFGDTEWLEEATE